jgi:hypothetical protein
LNFGLRCRLTSAHWKPVELPIALNLNFAARLCELTFALEIFVFGGPTVVVFDEPPLVVPVGPAAFPGARTVSVTPAVPWQPSASVTVTVIGNEPARAGVPESFPPFVRDTPPGSVPLSPKLYGGTPPEAANVAE